MEKRYSISEMTSYKEKLASVEAKQNVYQEKANKGQFELIYKFGVGVLGDDDIEINTENISMTGFTNPIELPNDNPFEDMT
jgi:acetoacetyl-[acyl-carrier protein] synthase